MTEINIYESSFESQKPNSSPYHGYEWADILRGRIPLSTLNNKVSQFLSDGNGKLTKEDASKIICSVIQDIRSKYTEEQLKPLYKKIGDKAVCEGAAFDQRKISPLVSLAKQADKGIITKDTIEYLKDGYRFLSFQIDPTKEIALLFSEHSFTPQDSQSKKSILKLIQTFDPSFKARKVKRRKSSIEHQMFTPGALSLITEPGLEVGETTHFKSKGGGEYITSDAESEEINFNKKDVLFKKTHIAS